MGYCDTPSYVSQKAVGYKNTGYDLFYQSFLFNFDLFLKCEDLFINILRPSGKNKPLIILSVLEWQKKMFNLIVKHDYSYQGQNLGEIFQVRRKSRRI